MWSRTITNNLFETNCIELLLKHFPNILNHNNQATESSINPPTNCQNNACVEILVVEVVYLTTNQRHVGYKFISR